MPRSKNNRRRKQRQRGNPDFQRRTQVAAPADPEIERRLRELLSPAALAPMRAKGRKLKRRERQSIRCVATMGNGRAAGNLIPTSGGW